MEHVILMQCFIIQHTTVGIKLFNHSINKEMFPPIIPLMYGIKNKKDNCWKFSGKSLERSFQGTLYLLLLFLIVTFPSQTIPLHQRRQGIVLALAPAKPKLEIPDFISSSDISAVTYWQSPTAMPSALTWKPPLYRWAEGKGWGCWCSHQDCPSFGYHYRVGLAQHTGASSLDGLLSSRLVPTVRDMLNS